MEYLDLCEIFSGKGVICLQLYIQLLQVSCVYVRRKHSCDM